MSEKGLLKECLADDVVGDCFSFSLYRNTENSIVFFTDGEEISEKKEYCQIYQQCFYLEELSQIQWSISKKNKTMETTMKQKLEIKYII